MPYVKSFDNTKIYYEIQGEGTPLVLLYSCGVTLDYWKFQEPLAEKYRLVLVDVGGIGKSGKERKENTFEAMAKDLEAVFDKEKLENAVILGLGMGAIIAIETARLLKEKVIGIISVDSLIPYSAYYGREATTEEITEVMKEYEGNYQAEYDALIRGMLGGRVDKETEDWIISVAGYEANDPAILREMVIRMLEYDYHKTIGDVKCQIKYLLRGLNNPIEKIVEEQKGAVVIEGAGHMSNIEKPKKFNEIIDQFMQELTTQNVL